MEISCPTCYSLCNIPNHRISEGKKTSTNCKECGGRIVVEVIVGTTKRSHPRTKTKNLVSYVGLDDSGDEIEHGMGKALDISMGGIFIETLSPITTRDIVLTATGPEGELVNIMGRVVNHRSEDSGMFRTGIQFVEDMEKNKSFIINMIKTHSKKPRH